MKKALIGTLCLLIGTLLGALVCWLLLSGNSSDPVFALTPDITEAVRTSAAPEDEQTPSESASIMQLALYTAQLLQQEDYSTLSTLIHPDYGVVFSPYATIMLSSAQCFSAAQFASLASDSQLYVWGQYDGTGDPIELNPEEYFARFVTDVDYTQAPVIALNNIVESGNALENIQEVFPDGQFVEFHYPAGPARHDWHTLRLVFEPYQGSFALVAIIHSEWTI